MKGVLRHAILFFLYYGHQEFLEQNLDLYVYNLNTTIDDSNKSGQVRIIENEVNKHNILNLFPF